MVDIIALLVIAIVLGCALYYIYKERKKGIKCIGCPSSGMCAGHCGESDRKKTERFLESYRDSQARLQKAMKESD